MTAERSRKSHARAWLVSISAVVVLYLLSAPPIMFMTASARLSGQISDSTVAFVWGYCEPYHWLNECKPMRSLTQGYIEWCQRRFAPEL
jgi:hypothetical protein